MREPLDKPARFGLEKSDEPQQNHCQSIVRGKWMTQVVGKPTPRAEGETKVGVNACYRTHSRLPNLLRSRRLGGAISSEDIEGVDIVRAPQAEGVKAAITGNDAPGLVTVAGGGERG